MWSLGHYTKRIQFTRYPLVNWNFVSEQERHGKLAIRIVNIELQDSMCGREFCAFTWTQK